MMDAIEAFRSGQMVLVMDDADREDECDLFLAAEFATEESMAFMIRETTGIICVVADRARLDRFGLQPATGNNTDKNATNFYTATDYLPGTSTGVSAADRAATVRAFVNLRNQASDFSKPGHMFPLCPKPGGLAERQGHTEAAFDLCRLANLPTVAAIGELMNREGRMLRAAESKKFAETHNLKFITVAEIKAAMDRPATLCGVETCRLPSKYFNPGTLEVFPGQDVEIVALVRGDVKGKANVPCRVHSECLTGDILGSLRCDCGDQLSAFLSFLGTREEGVLLYIRGHEGRGIGLRNKVKAYRLQDSLGLDTIDSNLHLGFLTDTRDFTDVENVLRDKLGVLSISLFTNNPEKASALGDIVASVQPLPSTPNSHNLGYLETKRSRLKHKTVLETMSWANEQKPGVVVAVVAAKWNKDFVDPLVKQCVEELEANNATVKFVQVPGAFDLLTGCRSLATCKEYAVSAIVCIGALIRGESDSYDYTCQALTIGIAQLNATLGFPPVIPGLLMCKDTMQASERSETALGVGWAKQALELVAMNDVLIYRH